MLPIFRLGCFLILNKKMPFLPLGNFLMTSAQHPMKFLKTEK